MDYAFPNHELLRFHVRNLQVLCPIMPGSVAESAVSQQLLQAEELLAGGRRYAGAAQLLLQALAEKNKNSLDIQLLLVKACLLRGGTELGKAVRHARTAVSLSASTSPNAEVQSLVSLGNALNIAAANPTDAALSERKTYRTEALQVLQKAVQLEPDDTLALYSLALTQAEAGQLQSALGHVRKILAAPPPLNAPTWALTGLILSAEDQYETAMAVIEAGLCEASAQQQPALLRIKAQLHLAQGDQAGALRNLTKVQARLQQGPNSIRSSNFDAGLLWVEIGRAFAEMGQLDDVAFCIQQACEQSGWTAQGYCLQAWLHHVKGDWQGAVHCCKSALALEPADAVTASILGQLLAERGSAHDLALARGHLSDATRLTPTLSRAWYLLGRVNQAEGQMHAAEDCLKVAAALEQSQPVLPFSSLHFPV